MNSLPLWHLIIIGSLIYAAYTIFRLLLKAILYALKASRQPRQKQVLKAAYLQLSEFQPGAGTKSVGLDLANIDASRLTQDDLIALANNTASSQPLMDSARAESEQLAAELAAAGH